MTSTIHVGDCRTILSSLDARSVRTCITSPPYWRKRDDGSDIGQEDGIDEYVENLVDIFGSVWRVLTIDGTLFVNIDDTYITTRTTHAERLPLKQLALIPDRFALAMQREGWWVRQRIIWDKTTCMPESVTDRFTHSHEYIFMFSKNQTYYWDQEAIKEPATYTGGPPGKTAMRNQGRNGNKSNRPDRDMQALKYENKNPRDVRRVAPQAAENGHTAPFPPKLIQPFIKATTANGDTVLDVFSGSGSTGVAANGLGRNYIGIEIDQRQADLSLIRIHNKGPLFQKTELK